MPTTAINKGRPSNCFILYRKAFGIKLREKIRNVSGRELSIRAAAEWNSLDEDERRPYYLLAQKEREEHARMHLNTPQNNCNRVHKSTKGRIGGAPTSTPDYDRPTTRQFVDGTFPGAYNFSLGVPLTGAESAWLAYFFNPFSSPTFLFRPLKNKRGQLSCPCL